MAGEPILVVDDTLVNLKLTRLLLADQGYEVLTATSAEEALKLLSTNRPRLVLTDIRLPGMNGLQLAQRIKSDEAMRDIQVVALAAFASQGEEEAAIRAGCEGCISKPVDHRLGALVRRFLKSGEDALPGDGPAAPLDGTTLGPLRAVFFEEAANDVRRWGADLDGTFDPDAAAEIAHQWIGTAGLLGYPEISEKARGLETALRARPMDVSELRESIQDLLDVLTSHA